MFKRDNSLLNLNTQGLKSLISKAIMEESSSIKNNFQILELAKNSERLEEIAYKVYKTMNIFKDNSHILSFNKDLIQEILHNLETTKGIYYLHINNELMYLIYLVR